MTLTGIFDAPVRTTVAGLWFVGAGFATTAAMLAMLRQGPAEYGAFLVAAAVLITIAVALLRSRIWAMAVSLVLLAGQIVGVAGTALELIYGIDARKAAELRSLGFDPTLGVAINLAFSLIAVCILVIALVRAKRSRGQIRPTR